MNSISFEKMEDFAEMSQLLGFLSPFLKLLLYLQLHVPPLPKTWKVRADSIACRRLGHGRIVRIDKDHQAGIPSDFGKIPTDQSISAAHLSTHPSFCEA